MSDIEETSNENTPPYDQMYSLLTAYTPYGAIYELAKELFDEKNHEKLNNLTDKYRAEETVNNQIEEWKRQRENPRKTRVIVKITNNTSHSLKLSTTDLTLDDSVRESLTLFPTAPMTFKGEFEYNFPYNSRSKPLFNHVMEFEDERVGVRFEFGLYVSSSFGVLTPTVKPHRKNNIASIGSSAIKCSSKIMEASDGPPFNFRVDITLG